MPLKVTLSAYTPDPLLALYTAYKRPVQLQETEDLRAKLQSDTARDKMRRYIEDKLSVGHTSPLEQIHFTFEISGVSRVLTNQLVRHRAGVSFEQQSLRYVRATTLSFITPPSIAKDEYRATIYQDACAQAWQAYSYLIERGTPDEDARFVLPLGIETKITMDINYLALLHMGDIRLCKQAQWEFRGLLQEVRRRVLEVDETLGAMVQPKCMPGRKGLCDEEYDVWAKCPLGGLHGVVRPHKRTLANWLTEIDEKVVYGDE